MIVIYLNVFHWFWIYINVDQIAPYQSFKLINAVQRCNFFVAKSKKLFDIQRIELEIDVISKNINMISKVFLLFIFVGCGCAKNDSELLSSSNGVNGKVDVKNSTKEFLVRHSFSLDADEHGKVDLERWRGEDCLRFCSILEAPRICYFHFVLEHYQVMGP